MLLVVEYLEVTTESSVSSINPIKISFQHVVNLQAMSNTQSQIFDTISTTFCITKSNVMSVNLWHQCATKMKKTMYLAKSMQAEFTFWSWIKVPQIWNIATLQLSHLLWVLWSILIMWNSGEIVKLTSWSGKNKCFMSGTNQHSVLFTILSTNCWFESRLPMQLKEMNLTDMVQASSMLQGLPCPATTEPIHSSENWIWHTF